MIQDAVDNAESTDTIQVCPGTYDENVTVGVPNLTITGIGDGPPVIDGSGGPHAITIDTGASGLTLSNFMVQNSDDSGVWTDFQVGDVTIET